MALLAKLLYGTGMRLMEGLRLRGKDRVVMLPRSLHETLKAQVGRARTLWTHDREVGIRTVQELLGHSDVSTTIITPMC